MVATLAVASPASAHPTPFSYVDVRVEGQTIRLMLVVHVVDMAHDLHLEPADRLLDPAGVASHADAISRLLEPRLKLVVDGRPVTAVWSKPEPLVDRQSLRIQLAYAVPRPPGTVAVEAFLFPYDTNHRTFLNIYERDDVRAQAILDRARQRFEYFSGSRQGVAAVVSKFVPAGVHHILIGPDHLLFLVGLLLLGGTVRRLLIVVTAFTVAHSLTLSLAALNVLAPPARLIEPAIALSIVYVGIDNLLVRNGRDVRAWIALLFGLIHGFGFASVLREMDLPARALGWSLFSFNIGVEIGQVAVVVAAASALAVLRSQSEAAGRRLAFAGSLVVIAAGAFWFVQRTFFPGGLS